MDVSTFDTGLGKDNNDPAIQGPTEVYSGQNYSGGYKHQLYNASTLQPSDVEAIVNLLAAGLPILQSPITDKKALNDIESVSSLTGLTEKQIAALALKMLETQHEIVNSIWEAFLKRLEEDEKRADKEQIEKWLEKVQGNGGPKSAAEYYAYIMGLSFTRREDEIEGGGSPLSLQLKKTFNRWVLDPMDQAMLSPQHDPLHYPSAAFMAGAIVASIDLVQGPQAGGQVSISPVSDALFAGGPHSGLPGDAQAAAAMIAALMYGGALSRSNADTIRESEKLNDPPRDITFAINFTKEILTILTNQAKQAAPKAPEEAQQDKLIGLTLASIALNLLYRTAYHGMTGEEMASLLSGNTSDLRADVKGYIEKLLAYIKGALPSNPAEKAATIEDLMKYVDESHSVDSMLETTRLFKAYIADKEQTDGVPAFSSPV